MRRDLLCRPRPVTTLQARITALQRAVLATTDVRQTDQATAELKGEWQQYPADIIRGNLNRMGGRVRG